MSNSSRNWLIIVLVVLVAAGATWYLFGDRIGPWLGLNDGQAQAGQQGQGQGQGQRPATPVTVAPVETRDIPVTVESVGSLQARESVTVTARMTGQVERIGFEEGEMVQAGQVLVELDTDEARARVQQAEAQRDEARRQWARGEAIRGEGLIPQADLDRLRAAYESAGAELEVVQAQLEDRQIVAPFTGRIGLRQVSPGALLQPGAEVARLSTVDPMELTFRVPADLLARLEPGLEVIARADGFQEPFQGQVTTLDTEIDPDTRTVALEASLPNPDGRLRPGLFVNVELVLEVREDALVVPEEALVLEGDDQYVFTVGQDDTVARTPVTTGERRPGFVEITDGLQRQARVVVDGVLKLRDGMPVQPRPRGAAPQDRAGQDGQSRQDTEGQDDGEASR